MALHLKKLCVGVSSVDELAASIEQRCGREAGARESTYWITTRSRPKREAEILGQDASLYWVINRLLCARQKIMAFRPGTRPDGKACIHIDLEPQLHLVKPRPHRPFQGWRYLEGAQAPADLLDPAALAQGAQSDDVLPPKLVRELSSLGLL